VSPDLERIALRWNDELLPALIAARNRPQAPVVEQLRRRLLELPQYGIQAFRFRDLLDPLKSDARRRWASLFGGEDEEGAVTTLPRDAVPSPAQTPPESAFESRQSFEHLTYRVSTSIRDLEVDPRTRTQLSTLWRYLGQLSGECAEPELKTAGENHPSYRRLALLLSIPRERLPMLFNLLRQLVKLA
jgi:hypothetical protein